MTDIKFPMIQTTKKTGNESLINFKGETIGTVLDFWKWAYSDLLDNAPVSYTHLTLPTT